MRSTNAREEVFGKRQVSDTLNLVNKDDNSFVDILEHNLDVEFNKSLSIAEDRVVLPPGLQVCLQPQLARQSISDAVVPTAAVGSSVAFSNLREIEYRVP